MVYQHGKNLVRLRSLAGGGVMVSESAITIGQASSLAHQ